MTRLWHATPSENVPSIMAGGLDPHHTGKGAGTARVHFSSDPNIASFIRGLYMTHRVALIEVDTRGLELEPGDDDDDTEFAYPGTIPTSRIIRIRGAA